MLHVQPVRQYRKRCPPRLQNSSQLLVRSFFVRAPISQMVFTEAPEFEPIVSSIFCPCDSIANGVHRSLRIRTDCQVTSQPCSSITNSDCRTPEFELTVMTCSLCLPVRKYAQGHARFQESCRARAKCQVPLRSVWSLYW